MNHEPYILDLPLSPEQDFKFMKEKGLDFIREHGGGEWSNLNTSDPGITILDQVCFALSELGYCTNFSLADIVTGIDDKINIKDQFYWPEQILTCSPVTLQDYVNYLTDEVEDVVNAVIIPVFANRLMVYQTYLLMNDAVAQNSAIEDVCTASFHVLNKCRNLGEIFLQPVALEKIHVSLVGRLSVNKTTEFAITLDRLQRSLDEHIFPPVKPKGFDELYAAGQSTEDVLNGPALKNGWVNPPVKIDNVQAIELNYLLQEITGEITGLKIKGDDKVYNEVTAKKHQVIYIDLWESVREGSLSVTNKHEPVLPAHVLSLQQQRSIPASEPSIHPAVLNNKLRELPASTYRDISSYYSIQNTFPEIFAAGADAVVTNAGEHEVARSRQLKGYLTLFDQVLANQFAQLANVDKLFSFSNTAIAANVDRKNYEIKKGQFKGIYPAPYKTFSPTYFYQSLYHVPHIKSLLKDHDVFRFARASELPGEQEQKNWEAYQLDPYNSYIHGLLNYVDDEDTNLGRRNKLLDHLLARHGESPSFIDAVIDGAEYTGEIAKDKVIIKSLLLQNLGMLSYYRTKAMNFLAADPVKENLHYDTAYHKSLSRERRSHHAIEDDNTITEKELVNFSQVELRINLLFGLKTQYDNYILENPENKQEIDICEWLVHQRRGLVMIEASLLQHFIKNPVNKFRGDDILLFFPSFIPHFMTKGFQERLDHFLQHSLPIGISYKNYFVDSNTLLQLIPVYGKWLNSIRYNPHEKIDGSQDNSIKLMDIIKTING